MIVREIVRILFTFSWDRFWVEYSDGSKESKTRRQLIEEVGNDEYYRLCLIASNLCGHWHNVQK